MPPGRIVFWVATVGALGLFARSVLISPVPLWLAAVALHAYVAVVLSGVFFLRLGMYVDAVCHGGAGARGVALTFDDGPHPVHTSRVLDLLRERGVRGTFFVIGEKAARHPELVRRMRDEGHEIGVHSWRHDRLLTLRSPRRVREDLQRCIDTLRGVSGVAPTLFRPPIGYTSPRVAAAVTALELDVIGWSVKGRDGLRGARPEQVARRVAAALEDGAIVLLHDASERDDFEPASLEALPRILDAIEARQLAVVPLADFLAEPAHR